MRGERGKVSVSLYDFGEGRVDAYLMLQNLFLFLKHANKGILSVFSVFSVHSAILTM